MDTQYRERSGRLPAPDEVFDMAAVRAELEADLARLRDQLGFSRSDFSELVSDPAAGRGPDEADRGVGAFAADYQTTVAVNVQGSVRQIERALDRIRAGSYGTCESCGCDIDPARLHARPRATLCLTCQQAHRP